MCPILSHPSWRGCEMLAKKGKEGMCECLRYAEEVWGGQRLGINLLKLKAGRGSLFFPQYKDSPTLPLKEWSN